jgi:hypothetical protein
MPGIGGTSSATPATNTLKSFGGLLPAFPGSGILNNAAGILGIATSATPIGAVAFAAGTIANIFGKHHQEALKKEGDALNGAVPAYAQSLQAIIAAVNAGQLNRTNGGDYVDQAISAYDSAVSSITNAPGASADSARCNAACYIRVHWVLPWAQLAKGIIQNGGTANFPAIPSHATQQGYPGFSLTVNLGAVQPGANTPPVSTGLPGGGQTPTALGPVGTTLGNGTVIPYSSQTGGSLGGAAGAPAGSPGVNQAGVLGGSILGFSTPNFLLVAGIILAGIITVYGISQEHKRGRRG